MFDKNSDMHIGRNISKIRELLNIKQEHLASLLKISQQTISNIEQTETLNDHTIERIARALNVPAVVITGYSDDLLLTFLANPNSLEKNAQVNLSDYLRLTEKLIELYERLLLAQNTKQ